MHKIHFFSKVIKRFPKICLFISLCTVCFFFHLIYSHILPLPANEWIDSNLKNIQIKNPESFSFAVFGGSRVSTAAFEGLLKQVDHDPEIAFVIDMGDAVLEGRKPFYRYFIKQIHNNLGIPLLPVMGDSELSGDGRDLYHKIFGPFYYSFRTGNNYFIVLDNVGEIGSDMEQIQWIENELKKAVSYDNRVIFMHRPFYNPDEKIHFMPEGISVRLLNLFRTYHVSHIFASGIDGSHNGNLRGIPYTVTGSAGGVPEKSENENYFSFLKVHVEKNIVDAEMKNVFMPGYSQISPLKHKFMTYAGDMIRIHRMELTLMVIILLYFAFYIIRNRKKSSGTN